MYISYLFIYSFFGLKGNKQSFVGLVIRQVLNLIIDVVEQNTRIQLVPRNNVKRNGKAFRFLLEINFAILHTDFSCNNVTLGKLKCLN